MKRQHFLPTLGGCSDSTRTTELIDKSTTATTIITGNIMPIMINIRFGIICAYTVDTIAEVYMPLSTRP
uniref:Uncharacterized protein n=1 Tax=Globodera pallida TaxID=36090 RepID=A0A183BTN4_GLOPA